MHSVLINTSVATEIAQIDLSLWTRLDAVLCYAFLQLTFLFVPSTRGKSLCLPDAQCLHGYDSKDYPTASLL
jgi:hypothetical protein